MSIFNINMLQVKHQYGSFSWIKYTQKKNYNDNSNGQSSIENITVILDLSVLNGTTEQIPTKL